MRVLKSGKTRSGQNRVKNLSDAGRRSLSNIMRSIFSIVLILISAFSFFPSQARAQSVTPEGIWPQFRGNPQLTGVAHGLMPREFRVVWTYEAGESIESSAAIVGGTVYVGSQSGELVALNLDNGAVRWKYRAGAIETSSPAVANGVVYIGDLNGVVHAVAASNGMRLWTYKTGSEIKSSPVVVGDKVLIGSYDEHLYCLSTSGQLLWRFKTEGAVHCAPGVLDGVAYVSGCDEMFRAIRISDGRELYRIPSGAYTGASPALVGNMAYYGTFNNEVLGVNLRTRRIAWRYRHPQRQFPFYSSATAIEGRVVVGGRDKMVHSIDAATGKRVWTFQTRARVESSPAVCGGLVFVGSNDGKFYVLDFYSGAKVWEFEAGAPVSASPAIANRRIVVGTQDGRLYCFG
jgi:outer membrane protein assembly factor BamB